MCIPLITPAKVPLSSTLNSLWKSNVYFVVGCICNHERVRKHVLLSLLFYEVIFTAKWMSLLVFFMSTVCSLEAVSDLIIQYTIYMLIGSIRYSIRIRIRIRISFIGQICVHIQGIWLRFFFAQCTYTEIDTHAAKNKANKLDILGINIKLLCTGINIYKKYIGSICMLYI